MVSAARKVNSLEAFFASGGASENQKTRRYKVSSLKKIPRATAPSKMFFCDANLFRDTVGDARSNGHAIQLVLVGLDHQQNPQHQASEPQHHPDQRPQAKTHHAARA
jgi:hypothetical protein